MMPDRYDELKKRLAVQQLKPQMGLPTEAPQQIDFGNDPIEVEAEYKGVDPVITPYEPEPTPAREPANGMDDQSAMYIGDAVASAGPGILSLLGGGSPAVVSSLFDKGEKYAKARGAQEEITKKNTSVVVDDDGSPINIRSRDAIGREPYYASKGMFGTGGKADRQFAPVAVKNIKTGEVKPAKTTGNGYVDIDSGVLLGSEWLPFKADQILRERTVQGGSVAKARDQYTGKLNTISGQRGLGDTLGGVSKEEASAVIKDASKAKTAKATRIADIENLKRIRDNLSVDSSPEEVAQSVEKLKRLSGGENRLSDIESQVFGGDKYKTYFTQAQEWATGKLAGKPDARVVEAYKMIAQKIIDSTNNQVQSVQRNYANPDLVKSKEGKKVLERVSGGDGPLSNSMTRDQQIQEELKKRKLRK